MSTRDLALAISRAVAAGEHDFYIAASGQHDIGGPLWSPDGQPLYFEVTNPGQRVGSMCLPGTRVVVDGAAPADAGWLNSGGEIIIKGDTGDTTGHCAAGGKIFVGGRSGTRTGSLMKHDPLMDPPQLWILRNTGSFSFEFMGGGRAVVCGHDCLTMPSTLGDRPCVGMVGGVVYFRGNIPDLPPEVCALRLDEEDHEFLREGLRDFLGAINKPHLQRDLEIWKHWHKIIPAAQAAPVKRMDMNQFRLERWFEKGLFCGNPDHDAFTPLVPKGAFRLHEPKWRNDDDKCVDCMICLKMCPRHAIKRRQENERIIYAVNESACIGCGICAASCPRSVWRMKSRVN